MNAKRSLRSVLVASAIAGLAALALPGGAAAWEFEELLNAQGDRGIGILQAASNQPGIAFGFGCEGSRWRQVALLPRGSDPLRLADGGAVRLGFRKDELGGEGPWKVREPAEGRRVYFAPSPSELMGRLYREEARNPGAVLYVQVRPEKKSPVTLEFPLRGLASAIRTHLWEPCKLDVYFGEPKAE